MPGWPLLAALGDTERELVLGAARRHTFARGEVVFNVGEVADSLHLVESGHLAVQVSTAEGDIAMLTVLSAGDFFGELSLSGADGERSATVVALDATVTRALSAAAYADLCRQHRSIERLLVSLLSLRVRELSERLLETMYVGLETRLCRRLEELADVYGTGRGPIVVPLTQEQLADLVGGTRPTVNQALQGLVAEGVVELGRGRVVVLDQQALARHAAR